MGTFTFTDELYGLHDALDALVLERFVAGAFPVARTKRLERARADAALMPAGVTPSRLVQSANRRSLLAEGPGWLLLVERYSNGVAELSVVADTEAIAQRVIEDSVAGAVEEPINDDTVPVAFWHEGCRGPQRSSRQIAAPTWVAMRHNYNAKAAAAFDKLSVLDPTTVDGRLLLLHGPPGTGKTTALRTLASAWRSWCTFEVVVDTERLFGSAGYLMHVLLGTGDDDDDDDDKPAAPPRWRLLVLEDCDELLRADAKKTTGQSLSRLLNVTDGFLGQGLRIFVALTTNEPLTALHPAIVRPGRCVAEVHVDRLTRAEAAKWLGPNGAVPTGDMTLAELFALAGEGGPVRAPEEIRPTGTYL
jgi:uncharacterized protein DUF5925/ATPase family protein associated with various cellular activities (AAA)